MLPSKRALTGVFFLALLIFAVGSNIAAEKAETYDAKVALLTDTDFFPVLLRSMDEAKKEIICSLYMFKTDGGKTDPTSILLNSMITAAKRGVEVTVVFDMGEDSGELTTIYNSKTAKSLTEAGIEVLFDEPERRLHAKMCVIDMELSFVGSHNYTYSGFMRNREVTAKITSPEIASEAAEYIRSVATMEPAVKEKKKEKKEKKEKKKK